MISVSCWSRYVASVWTQGGGSEIGGLKRQVDNAALAVPQIGATSDAAEAQRWAFVLFGLGLWVRVVYYLLRFPLRGDEARLAIHFVETSFSQLAHPSEHTMID